MERFTKLFGSLIVFVYHCFDRVVIHGYLSGLSRPEQAVYFFRPVLCIPAVSKEVLRQPAATSFRQKLVCKRGPARYAHADAGAKRQKPVDSANVA